MSRICLATAICGSLVAVGLIVAGSMTISEIGNASDASDAVSKDTESSSGEVISSSAQPLTPGEADLQKRLNGSYSKRLLFENTSDYFHYPSKKST